jgi:hypothetical protein
MVTATLPKQDGHIFVAMGEPQYMQTTLSGFAAAPQFGQL